MGLIRNHNFRVKREQLLADNLDGDVEVIDADVPGDTPDEITGVAEAIANVSTMNHRLWMVENEVESTSVATDALIDGSNESEDQLADSYELQGGSASDDEINEHIGLYTGRLSRVMSSDKVSSAMKKMSNLMGQLEAAGFSTHISSSAMMRTSESMETVESDRRYFNSSQARLKEFTESVKKYAYAFYDAIIAGIRKIMILIQKGIAKVKNFFSNFEAQAAALEKRAKDMASKTEVEGLLSSPGYPPDENATQGDTQQAKQYKLVKRIVDDGSDDYDKLLSHSMGYVFYGKLQEGTFKSGGDADINIDGASGTAVMKEAIKNIRKVGESKAVDSLKDKFSKKIDGNLDKLTTDFLEILNKSNCAVDAPNGAKIKMKFASPHKGDILEIELDKGEYAFFTGFTGGKVSGLVMTSDDDDSSAAAKKRFKAVKSFDEMLDCTGAEYDKKDSNNVKSVETYKVYTNSMDEVKSLIAYCKKAKSEIDKNNNKCFGLLENSLKMLEQMKSANRLEEGELDKDRQRFLKILIQVFKKLSKDQIFQLIATYKDSLAIASIVLKNVPTKDEVKNASK